MHRGYKKQGSGWGHGSKWLHWNGKENLTDESVKELRVSILMTQKSPMTVEEPSENSRITRQMSFCFSKGMLRGCLKCQRLRISERIVQHYITSIKVTWNFTHA